MAFQWAGAASGANDALQTLLARRMAEQLAQARVAQEQQQLEQQAQAEANRAAMAQEQMALQRRGFEADEADRKGQRQRQTQQDDIAAADRRQTQNKAGVRSKVLEGLRAKTTDPRTAQLMAAGEGVDIGMDVLDPEKEQRDRIAQIQEQGKQTRANASGSDFMWVVRGGKPIEIRKGTAQPGDVPYDEVAARQAAPPNSQYSDERRVRVRQTIDEILGKKQPDGTRRGGMISPISTGVIGALAQSLPATEARYLKGKLKTLGSGIAFGELTEMREASKTGGALGQVAVRELELLESALGALDQGLAGADLTTELEKIEGALDRWERAKAMGGSVQMNPGAAQSGQFRILSVE